MPDTHITIPMARLIELETAEFRAADMREARHGYWRAVEHGFEDSKTPNLNSRTPTVR